jgi:hypothetical protein
MLNLADCMFLLTFVAGPTAGLAAAVERQAGIVVCLLFSLGGLVVSSFVGPSTRWLAYKCLFAKKWYAGLALLGYTSVSMLGMAVTIILPFGIAAALFGSR